MSEISVADRRRLVNRAQLDPQFLDRLQQDSIVAIAEETGVSLPVGMDVCVILEENNGPYVGVLPRTEALAHGLPEPTRFRDVWENLLLATAAMDDEARHDLLADPVGFTTNLAGNSPGKSIEIMVETETKTFLVVPASREEDELDDYALDLVNAGGGDPACAGGSGFSRT